MSIATVSSADLSGALGSCLALVPQPYLPSDTVEKLISEHLMLNALKAPALHNAPASASQLLALQACIPTPKLDILSETTDYLV